MNDKNYFDIHRLIAVGKEAVREYKLPVGTVLIRPLTEFEIEEAEFAMFDTVRDPKTREFAFKVSMAKASGEDLIKDEDLTEIDFTEFARASNEYVYHIAYLAMRDFTDDFKKEDLKRIPGIKELAEEVIRISGYSEQTQEMVEEFREK